MAPERDLFANFERMRREMDELFGDVFERTGILPRGRAGFSPRVDVYYCGEPPRAIVKAELAGIDNESLALELRGRELTIAGKRVPSEADDRVYQQVEIEHGPFRRVIVLNADVVAEEARASYEDGVLRIEIPLANPRGRARTTAPIEAPRGAEDPSGR
jgi:HSP20 family protein